MVKLFCVGKRNEKFFLFYIRKKLVHAMNRLPHKQDGESDDLESRSGFWRAAARAVVEIHPFVAVHVH
jgi:hypothetical protein